ncbi:MAG: glycosyltransferase family 9 protein [Bryobacteraceae bacterium]
MRPKSKSNVLPRLPSGARAAIVRLRSLGDCVLTTPAIRLLKETRPDLEIAIVVEPRFAPIFANNPDIDQILNPDLTSVARFRPELTLNLHGGARSVQLTVASRARWRAGFAHFRLQSIYNVRIPRAQEILNSERKVHTAEHLASAMFFLGVPFADIPRARLFAGKMPTANIPSAPAYAVIHPAASASDKTWPAERFLEIASYLQHQLSLDPVFIAGPDESLAPFEQYRTVSGAPLEQIKSLLAGATLFVGNDSGPAHMAAAFGVPVVVLFGSSDPDIWSPWKTEAVVLRSDDGIASIATDQVINAISTFAALAVT